MIYQKALEKTFKKYIYNYDEKGFNQLVIHSKEIYSALENTNFLSPKVIKASNMTIYYEYLNIERRMDKVWQNNIDMDNKVFEKIGEMLRLIHFGDIKNLLHGDFVLHNIFLNSSKDIVLIDAHPPEVIGYDESFLYGNSKVEMYLFLLNITSSIGLKFALKNLIPVRQAIKKFRYGYKSNNSTISLFRATLRFYRIRRASKFSISNSLAHISAALFLICISYE